MATNPSRETLKRIADLYIATNYFDLAPREREIVSLLVPALLNYIDIDGAGKIIKL